MKETHLLAKRQTTKLGLIKIIKELFPQDHLKTAYSIQNGVFCKLTDSALSIREVKQIETKLKEWVKDDIEIDFLGIKDHFYKYDIGDFTVDTIYPTSIRSSLCAPFRLIPFSSGFIIDFGNEKTKDNDSYVYPEKLSATYEKTHSWLETINMESVSDLNNFIKSGRSLELINIAEARQEKEIADVADEILQHRRAIRVILISGPSSSGKTTFLNRLSTQLRVNGLKPIPLSLDDYFINREVTPKDKSGNYDYENLSAIDLKLLHQQIKELIDGKTIEAPIFDFVTGHRLKKTKKMRLKEDEILVIEGIHALNPELMPSIFRNIYFKIYISALFGANVNLVNRVPTTEVRLIRRMIRDDKYRGCTPGYTFRQWPSVRRGEHNNVFKFQEQADAMFNSSLLFEMNALRPFAESTFKKVDKNSPYYSTVERLNNLLSFFEPIDIAKVPFNSILREFIGGSIYFD
jgi:uridine kinase